MAKLIITENQYNRLFENNTDESIQYTSVGTPNKPVINMRVNHDLDDRYNTDNNNVDTRAFGYKTNMLNWSSNNSISGKEKFFAIGIVRNMYISAIEFGESNGKSELYLPTDEELSTDSRLSDRQAGLVKKTRNKIRERIDKCAAIGNYDELIKYCQLKLSERALSDEISINTYNRANDFKRNPFKKYGNLIPRYNVGTVPNTNVKVIALFTMSDFNFSDAIKHGTVRPSTSMQGIIGHETQNEIPVTYDNGIPASVENNFSIPETDNQDHFKRQFGYGDENYTSVTQFIDKSIMYASFALNKENYAPQYIIAAPSSSRFNEYYSQSLARKLNGAEFVPDFFQRNLINFTNEDGQSIVEEMRHNNVHESLIFEFQKTMENVALGEIANIISQPMRTFIKKNYQEISNISAEHYSRQKVNMDYFTRVILRYTYNIILKIINETPQGENSNLSKYLTEVCMHDNSQLKPQELYLIGEFRNRIKLKFGKKAFGNIIEQMYNLVASYSQQLTNGRGYKLKFNKPFKITKLSKYIRPYLKQIYVVADKNFNENHELFSRYANGKFLIIDEDLNSGATLANVIYALQNAMPAQHSNNIMCLTNAYSPKGR